MLVTRMCTSAIHCRMAALPSSMQYEGTTWSVWAPSSVSGFIFRLLKVPCGLALLGGPRWPLLTERVVSPTPSAGGADLTVEADSGYSPMDLAVALGHKKGAYGAGIPLRRSVSTTGSLSELADKGAAIPYWYFKVTVLVLGLSIISRCCSHATFTPSITFLYLWIFIQYCNVINSVFAPLCIFSVCDRWKAMGDTVVNQAQKRVRRSLI